MKKCIIIVNQGDLGMRKNWLVICLFILILSINIYLVISINKINNNLNNIETYITNTNSNAPLRLNLLSSYGDNQAIHPKVITFNKKWHGYKYYMAFSPYPYANSKYENPHIKASNDLINWEDVGSNPLDEVDNYDKGLRYNSDPHLVYNNDLDELECFWRYVDEKDKIFKIYLRRSKDGIHWTKKEEIFSGKRDKIDWLSPSIIYEDEIYKIWYVFNNKVWYVESSDLKDFSIVKEIKIEYEDGVKSWHIDVIHTLKGYEMLLVAFSDWNHHSQMNLYYTYSTDNINYDIAKVILKPTTGTNYWDNKGLYRSSFIYENNKYYVFYSGIGTNNARGIGLMTGKNIYNLKAVNY